MKLDTLAIHAARQPDPSTGAIAPPLVMSTTFERDADGTYPRGHYYGRAGNPNRGELEAALAALEDGAGACAFASGQQATLSIFMSLRPGDHVVVGHDCYWGTRQQLRAQLAPLGVTHSTVDTTDLAAVAAAFTPATRLLWAETPSNPLLRVSDLAALAALAHARGAVLVADNTFATPVLQQPLRLGADLVLHSTTKYIGGHSDLTGGVVVVREPGRWLTALRAFQLEGGGVPSPFDCWLARRSLMTLPVRVRTQAASAAALAERLAQHPSVTAVHYPGLSSHPQHDIARRQMAGFGAMLSFEVRGGMTEALGVAARLRLFTRATSLGGVESLVEHRASMEGPGTATPASLLRVSVGLEDESDLAADLSQALDGL
ncbi:MAG: trans-sulfuration enzyme family protein [Gammaproteobacteria bacterium]